MIKRKDCASCSTTLAIAALLLASFARADAPRATSGYSELPGRPSESRSAEPASLKELQRRLDAAAAANGAGCGAVYEASKAQAWLNFSKYAAAEQLPRVVREAGLARVEPLVVALETQRPPATDVADLPASRHVRDDLWQAVQAVKRDGRLCAAPKMAAYCEVQLAWAGYEAAAGGVRHVDPYVRIAEDYCAAASTAVPVPLAPPPALEPVAPSPPAIEIAPAPPPAPTAPSVDLAELSLNVLFPHNKSARADIRKPGRAELRKLAAQLKSLPAGVTILIVGHADLTGHPHYNERLSKRRANSVALELKMLGVNPAQIRVDAAGSKSPVVHCGDSQVTAGRRRFLSCLEPNRRVVVELTTDAR
jgi:OmpA-OmpF porin, OOP family